MPLTPFQSEILRRLASNRSPESFVGGATPIIVSSSRISRDVDVYHDRPERMAEAMERDAETLLAAGFLVEWRHRHPTHAQAVVRRRDDSFVLEWVVDSDFRFFPAVPDEQFGFRLHPVDIATNKLLAAAGRREPRDAVDLVRLHRTLLPIGYLAWAATAKDPGLTPYFILNELMRTARYRQEELEPLTLTEAVDAAELRRAIRTAVEEGRALIDRLPPDDVGCIYLDAEGNPAAPDPARLEEYRRHFGSRSGHWPTSSEILSEMARREE